jgi:ribosomal protein L40E
MAKKSRLGQKQCPKCEAWIKGTRAKACPKCGYKFRPKQKTAPEPVAPVEKAANTVTVEQVKAVAQTIKVIGGFDRLNELLGLIREVGGLRRFKDLLDAMQ